MARNKIPAGRRKKLGAATIPKRSAVPDRLDLRDRLYLPPVAVVPGVTFAPKTNIPVLDQGQTNACTGFALASVVYQLQHSAKRKQIDCCVSPFMLYSMARRYDEFPGAPDVDTGSSLRGAMKGWYKHGACSDRLWTTENNADGPSDKVSRRLVARCRAASTRGLLPRRHAFGYRYARGTQRDRHSLCQRCLPLRLG